MKKKNLTILSITVLLAVAGILFINAERPDEKQIIIKHLESADKAFLKNDYNSWAKHWKHSQDVLLITSRMESFEILEGWQELSTRAKEVIENNKKRQSATNSEKAQPKLNFNSVIIEGDMAWADLTKKVTNQSGETFKQKRTHTLQKLNGDWKIINTNILNISSYKEGKFVVDANKTPETTHVHLDDFPKDMVFPMIDGWGGMCVDINTAVAGTNFSPLLAGLKNDHCQVPHWGYIVKGAIRMEYEDGTQEVFSEGEAFFMKPGHTGEVEEDLLLVSFGPEEGIKHLVEHFERKVSEMNQQ